MVSSCDIRATHCGFKPHRKFPTSLEKHRKRKWKLQSLYPEVKRNWMTSHANFFSFVDWPDSVLLSKWTQNCVEILLSSDVFGLVPKYLLASKKFYRFLSYQAINLHRNFIRWLAVNSSVQAWLTPDILYLQLFFEKNKTVKIFHKMLE